MRPAGTCALRVPLHGGAWEKHLCGWRLAADRAALSGNTTFVWKNARQRMRAHQSHQWTKHACRGEENNEQTAFGQWRNLKFRVKITIWGDMHPCPWAWQVLHISDRLNTEMNKYGGGGFLVFYNKCVNIQKTLLNSLNQNFPNDHSMVSHSHAWLYTYTQRAR